MIDYYLVVAYLHVYQIMKIRTFIYLYNNINIIFMCSIKYYNYLYNLRDQVIDNTICKIMINKVKG